MKLLSILQIISAVLLILLVLLSNQGTTIGGAFGGGENQVWRSRRGAEKLIFTLVIIFGTIFVGLAIANIVL